MKSFKYYLEMDNKSRAALIPIYFDEKENKYYVMLMKPSDPAYGGSDFQFCKGQIDPGENALQTAIREAKEELGIKIKNAEDVKLLWDNKNYNMKYYFVIVDSKKQNYTPHFETSAVVWWDLDKAEKDMRDWQRKVIPMIKRRLGIK